MERKIASKKDCTKKVWRELQNNKRVPVIGRNLGTISFENTKTDKKKDRSLAKKLLKEENW